MRRNVLNDEAIGFQSVHNYCREMMSLGRLRGHCNGGSQYLSSKFRRGLHDYLGAPDNIHTTGMYYTRGL